MDNKPKFQKGDRVVISGLQATTQYNGKLGTVMSIPKTDPLSETSRYGVQIDGTPLEKVISIKLANLTLCRKDSQATKSSPLAQVFQVGDRVILHGLKTAKYNGKRGIVIAASDPHNEGRYGVRLLNGPKEAFRARPINLRKETVQKTTKELRKERDEMQNAIHLTTDESADATQMEMMRKMMNMFMTDRHQIELFGRKIEPMPDFRKELLQTGGFPPGVDKKWADERLRSAFEQDSMLPHMLEMLFKRPGYQPSPKDIFKRLGTNEREKLTWYMSAKRPGCIYDKHVAHPYCQSARHDFSNQAYRREMLVQGKTHVAVGFVDLGLLMTADLLPGDDPLRFIGIERSAFAVAKTHVIWEMLKQIPVTLSISQRDPFLVSVMQVWFSSTWTRETEKRARAALSSLCSSATSYHPEVKQLLDHWLIAPTMPLKRARVEYASSTTDSRSSTGFMKLKHDRIAMAKYELTGDFGVGEKPFCGNMITFDCPDGTPPSALDQSAFAALNFKGIMDIAADNPKKTVMSLAEEYALSELRRLAQWCQSEKVVLELRCSPFEELVDEIAAEHPWTMSWSNLVDYVDYDTFHTLARQCSKYGDTIHFGYSMNWSTIVFGTNIIDYMGEQMADLRGQLLEGSDQSTKQSYANFGWDKRIRLPLPQNPINTTCFGLELVHHKAWVDYFFGKARRRGPCNVANVEHAMGSPLASTGNSTVAFTWTYDPEISFHAHNNRF
jgi:hypothetical protein